MYHLHVVAIVQVLSISSSMIHDVNGSVATHVLHVWVANLLWEILPCHPFVHVLTFSNE